MGISAYLLFVIGTLFSLYVFVDSIIFGVIMCVNALLNLFSADWMM